MDNKPHKKHTPKADAKLLEDIKKYLRAVAPQVKFIYIDNLFTGEIKLTERYPYKTKPGYQVKELTFKDFDEVKKHYGPIPSKDRVRDAKPSDKPRKKPKGDSRSSKGSVEKQQPKGRDSRRNNVQSRKAGRKVRGVRRILKRVRNYRKRTK